MFIPGKDITVEVPTEFNQPPPPPPPPQQDDPQQDATLKTENLQPAQAAQVCSGQGYILCILIISPTPFEIQFFSPTNMFASGGAKQKDAF